MKKYVAFLDILGFKNKLKQLGQESAKRYISAFSETAYQEWKQIEARNVEGYIVSDSFILYTKSVTKQALNELLKIIDTICKKEFSDNKILIRGAIAKGEFEKMPAVELASLSKGLMVGQAYVDAYTLEDSAKIAGMLLTQEVYDDIREYNLQFECGEEKNNNGSNYVMRYLDFDFLSDHDNLLAFVSLAADSNWLPHYYNTLYFALKKENNPQKAYIIFDNIIGCIGDPGESWRDIDKFIKNALDKDVMPGFQTRFLGYLREKIMKNSSVPIFPVKRPGNMERVLKFIEERSNVTLTQISSTLGLSHASTVKILDRLVDEGTVQSAAEEVAAGNNTKRTVKTYSVNNH